MQDPNKHSAPDSPAAADNQDGKAGQKTIRLPAGFAGWKQVDKFAYLVLVAGIEEYKAAQLAGYSENGAGHWRIIMERKAYREAYRRLLEQAAIQRTDEVLAAQRIIMLRGIQANIDRLEGIIKDPTTPLAIKIQAMREQNQTRQDWLDRSQVVKRSEVVNREGDPVHSPLTDFDDDALENILTAAERGKVKLDDRKKYDNGTEITISIDSE